MEKRRSVKTSFWEDSWIESLDCKNKLLFLYLLTSPLSNILGIYEISVKRISFDTGITEETVLKSLKDFETSGKVKYIDGCIFIKNHLKNQSLNPNMKKGAYEIYKNLPNSLKDSLNINGFESFESLSNGLGKYEEEEEREDEDELEVKDENINVIEVINYLNKVTNKKFSSSGKANVNFITARLKEGRTVEDLKRVIDLKAAKWKDDPKMNDYLRPETLFNPTKFESYINEIPVNKVVEVDSKGNPKPGDQYCLISKQGVKSWAIL